MSAKSTSKGESSKLPPVVESVITRRQSAQQKRQLRNKDSSIKRISQFAKLLLSPTKTTPSKSPPTKSKSNGSKNLVTIKPAKSTKEKIPEKKDVKQSPKKAKLQGKVVKKVQSTKNVETLAEYYPNKLKRALEGKKVVLKPKHEMKVVVGTRIRKRKLVLPQKGADSGLRSPPPKVQKTSPKPAPKPKPPRLELSIEDLVHLHNDETLDDEDWMEILTCPSPVWWEDPPDPWFDEEPRTMNILRTIRLPVKRKTTEIQEAERKMNNTEPDKTHLQNEGNITKVLSEGNVKVLEMKKADDKFMRKRSKLENLLGNIRNKINDFDESGQRDNKSNTDSTSIDPITREESDVIIKADAVNLKNIDSVKPHSVSDSKSISPVPKKEKKTSESTEEDPFSSFRDEDLLNDLENLEIPMKTEDNYECDDKETESFLDHSSNVHENRQEKVNAEDNSDCNSLQDRSEDSYAVVTFQPPFREGNSQISKLTTTSIETDVSVSPMSTKSLNSISDETYETSSVKSQDIDTISDTNIKFIDEDDVSSSKSCDINEKNEKSDEVKVNNEISDVKGSTGNQESQSCSIENVSQSSNTSKEKDNARKEKDCMTVYKIISNEKGCSKINKDSKNNNSMISKINELIKASKEYNNFKVNLKSNEASVSKLDSFYKKHKNHQSRQLKKPDAVKNNSTGTLDNNDQQNELHKEKIVNIDEIETTNEKTKRSAIVNENTQINDENHTNDDKKSIVVSNSSCKIKYCLKCSCIFDTDDCNYCVEKAVWRKQENSEVETFLCELCSCKTENENKETMAVSEH